MQVILRHRLKQLREGAGFKQIDIAEIIGISRSAYTLWETGKRNPNIDDIVKIANLYDVTLDWLVGRDKPEQYHQQ